MPQLASMVQRDYLMRMIEQFIEAIARMLGLAKTGQFDAARAELDAAYASLGISRGMVDRLDDASLRLLLRDDKLRILVMLLEAEGELLSLQGQDAQASAIKLRAARLKTADR
jgi:hypothetical protein